YTSLELGKLFRNALGGRIRETTPTVMPDAEPARGLKDGFRMRGTDVDDFRGNHRQLKPGPADFLGSFGEIFLDALRQHMATLAYSEVNAVKTNFFGNGCHFPAIGPLKVLGENGDFQGPGGCCRRRKPACSKQSGGADSCQQVATRNSTD